MRIVPRAIVKGVTAASVCLVVVLASPSRADVITDWNQTAIAAMKAANIAGNPWTRNMAMMHVAMSDAVNSVQNKYAIYAAGRRSGAIGFRRSRGRSGRPDRPPPTGSRHRRP